MARTPTAFPAAAARLALGLAAEGDSGRGSTTSLHSSRDGLTVTITVPSLRSRTGRIVVAQCLGRQYFPLVDDTWDQNHHIREGRVGWHDSCNTAQIRRWVLENVDDEVGGTVIEFWAEGLEGAGCRREGRGFGDDFWDDGSDWGYLTEGAVVIGFELLGELRELFKGARLAGGFIRRIRGDNDQHTTDGAAVVAVMPGPSPAVVWFCSCLVQTLAKASGRKGKSEYLIFAAWWGEVIWWTVWWMIVVFYIEVIGEKIYRRLGMASSFDLIVENSGGEYSSRTYLVSLPSGSLRKSEDSIFFDRPWYPWEKISESSAILPWRSVCWRL